jgi:Peptidase A4 family
MAARTKVLRKEYSMTDFETLRRQLPFELIPTKVPNVYTLPAPPEDFEFETAGTKLHRKYGLLWRRPTASDHPALREAWQKLISRKWHPKDRIVPRPQPRFEKKLPPRKPFRKVAEGVWTGNNWAGGIATGSSWNSVSGYWTVPTVSQPSEPAGDMTGDWESSVWVGLDGFVNSSDVMQIGTQQNVLANLTSTYQVFYQWFIPAPDPSTFPLYGLGSNPPLDPNGYPKAWVEDEYQYIYPQPLDIEIMPGHEIHASVQYVDNNTMGLFMIGNLTTGANSSFTVAPPPGAQMLGNTAEWILECPTGVPNNSLPQFTTVQFSSAIACGIADGGFANVAGPAGPPTGNNVTIIQPDSGNNLATVEPAQQGPFSETISFAG